MGPSIPGQSSGLASGTRSYTYDLDGNRLTKTEGGVTFTSAYDRADELLSVIKTGGSTQTFGYDAYGNMTADAETAAAVTAMTYDLDDHLTAIDATGTANDATFTIDALGRNRTRVLASSTDTYSYLGTGETVTRVANSVAGDHRQRGQPRRRPARGQGRRDRQLVPARPPRRHRGARSTRARRRSSTPSATTPTARRSPPGTAGGTRVGADTWKYQGRLDVSPTGLGTPLYDMSARFYDPGIGAFTQADSVMGKAQNPLSMNRFLYAAANPATLIDPTGHCWAQTADGLGLAQDLGCAFVTALAAVGGVAVSPEIAAVVIVTAAAVGTGYVVTHLPSQTATMPGTPASLDIPKPQPGPPPTSLAKPVAGSLSPRTGTWAPVPEQNAPGKDPFRRPKNLGPIRGGLGLLLFAALQVFSELQTEAPRGPSRSPTPRPTQRHTATPTCSSIFNCATQNWPTPWPFPSRTPTPTLQPTPRPSLTPNYSDWRTY